LPVPVPVMSGLFAGAGQTWAAAIEAFRMEEIATVEIAQREVGQIHLVRPPGLRYIGRVFQMYALTKKREFISEPVSVPGAQIARVIPPFRLKIVMGKMISRERVLV